MCVWTGGKEDGVNGFVNIPFEAQQMTTDKSNKPEKIEDKEAYEETGCHPR